MDPKSITKKYSNGDVTVVWKPGSCIHSTICWKAATGLPAVFNPSVKPWIKMDGSATDKIIDQVKKCPSGALSYYLNADGEQNTVSEARVEVMMNGPLMVYGNLTVKDLRGNETKKFKVTAFCRCGLSANKPYCDGSHIQKKVDE